MEPQRLPAGAAITGRDLAVLEMAAEHRLILPAHAAALLGVSASTAAARLRRLTLAGHLRKGRLFAGEPPHFQITSSGLALAGSTLPRPHRQVGAYDHDVGVAWLWLAARGGTFGRLREVISERALRSRDGRLPNRPAHLEEPLGVRLGGVGAHGGPRLHYPDLLLVTPEGHRIAVELELSSKGRARRDRILAGYGADARIEVVLYLVEETALARAIQSSARRLGISSLVHVQRVIQPARAGDRGVRGAHRQPAAREL